MRGTVVVADAMMSGGDGQPETLAGVTVTLDGEHAMGETMETGMTGGFAFTGLRSGTYTVTISDFPEDVSFETVSVEVEVEVGEIGNADFTGHFIRTSAVEGEVIIDGDGLAGVTVTLIGGPADENFTTMTDSDGMYRFEDLRPGDYTVSISDFDTRDYNFAVASQDVSVDLDETATVPFTGQLLRTSGISGRVSVEGMGLSGIEVTLSGAADRTETTDAGGQYAFSGLAAGDYTVSIAVDDPAYVFDEMSKAVTVGDDDAQIVPFDGQHARTASVSGRFFIDELDKNDMMDAGEDAVPAPGVRVDLTGPGVGQTTSTQTGPDGSFMFSGLRAGSYRLVVPIDAAAAAALMANDVAYGGEAAGYRITLGVGEAASQDIPLDITHTTVNFTVSLRSGDEMGDALPGASVQLYGANSAMVGSGTTGDDGSVAIKVARAMTSGNMVNAGVSAEGYHVADGMTEVSWDPQMFATEGSNSNDIVNLNVDVSISGATVARGDYGGEALAGWAIDVMMGDATVAGAPTALGDDGSVAFTTTVESVPASFTFTVADDQDDELDSGEMYQASGGGYTHTGLKVAGSMDADPIVVTYTTQTLKVFVHHERDQVRGYTGNALDGDERTREELVNIEVRSVGNGGITRALPSQRWNARANTSHSSGEYTFSHLPADMDIVVQADARDGYMLLDHRQLATYRDLDANGVMGGAFGAMGGWGHTVSLCPLTETEPTGQDFGTCASFALVKTHDVHAKVSKKTVSKSGNDFGAPKDGTAKDITVTLEPVEGKNLAGDGRSFTTLSSDDPTTPINEKAEHNFVSMAAGTYDIGLTDGWMGMVRGSTTEAAAALSPLAGDLELDITPSTTILYGKVTAQDNFGLEGVTVTVNGKSATTDKLGRYIVTGISAERGQLFVNTARAGYPATKADSTDNPKTDIPAFAANTPMRHDISLRGANNTVLITGVVTEAGTNAPLKGVEIKVDYSGDGTGTPEAPLNVTGNTVKTGDDGSYEAVVRAQPTSNPLVHMSAHHKDYHFLPLEYPVSALAGSTGGTANFEGRKAAAIFGRVVAPGGNEPMSYVVVTASWTGGGNPGTKKDTTDASGTFSIPVPTLAGSVEVTAAPLTDYHPADYSTADFSRLVLAENYVWFDPPAHRPDSEIIVIPGQSLDFGTFQGMSVQPRITKVERVLIKDVREGTGINPDAATRGFPLGRGEPTDTIKVTWEYETRNAFPDLAASPAAADFLPYAALDQHDGDPAVQVDGAADVAAGTNAPTLDTKKGTGGSFAAVNDARTDGVSTPESEGRGTANNGTTVKHKRVTTYVLDHDGAGTANDLPDYDEIDLRIGHAVINAGGTVEGVAAGTTGIPATGVTTVTTPARGVWQDLAAVNTSITGLTVNHTHKHSAVDNTVADEITVTWLGNNRNGSPSLEHRIALYVPVVANPTESDWEWVVFDARNNTAAGGPSTATSTESPIDRQNQVTRSVSGTGTNWGKWTWKFQLNQTASVGYDHDSNAATPNVGLWYSDDGTSAQYALTLDQLTKATKVRVDTRVDIQVATVAADGPPVTVPAHTVHTYSGSGWMKQAEAAIPAPKVTP